MQVLREKVRDLRQFFHGGLGNGGPYWQTDASRVNRDLWRNPVGNLATLLRLKRLKFRVTAGTVEHPRSLDFEPALG